MSASTIVAAATAIAWVRRRTDKAAHHRRVGPDSTSRAIIGTGSTRLSTTWLSTSASVELTPMATTITAGIMVTNAPHPQRNAEADEVLHDHLTGHRADD